MSRGVFLIQPSAGYALIDGRTLVAELDGDQGGVAFITPSRTTEYVLRESFTGGAPCTALWERRWEMEPDSAGPLTPVLVPSDFTLYDVTPLEA